MAGLNYKLTLAILQDNNICRGAIRGITVYKPLPHTGQGLAVTSWGKTLDCTDTDILNMLQDATMVEAEQKVNALEVEGTVEGTVEEEREEVEPDA